MQRLAIEAAVLAGCAPAWLTESYRPVALEHAREAAGREHDCPRERIRVRCDSTQIVRPEPGEALIAFAGSKTGRIVDAAPLWSFELDVCGDSREYTSAVVSPNPSGEVYTEGFVEAERGCPADAVCVDDGRTCRSVDRGPLWAIPSSPGCRTAAVDERLAVRVVEAHVRAIVPDLGATLALEIDGRWWSLYGEDDGSTERATGIVLGAGHHELALHHGCTSSPTLRVDVVDPTDTSWFAD